MDQQRFGSAFKFVFISKLAMMRKLKAEVDFRGLIFFVLANVYLYDTFFRIYVLFCYRKAPGAVFHLQEKKNTLGPLHVVTTDPRQPSDFRLPSSVLTQLLAIVSETLSGHACPFTTLRTQAFMYPEAWICWLIVGTVLSGLTLPQR